MFSLPHPFLSFRSCLPFQSDFVPSNTYCWHKWHNWEESEWRLQPELWWFILAKQNLPDVLLNSFNFLLPFICLFPNFFPFSFALPHEFPFYDHTTSPALLHFLFPCKIVIFPPSQPSTLSCKLHCTQQKGANKLCSCSEEKQALISHHWFSILQPYIIHTPQCETRRTKKNWKPLKSLKRVNIFWLF